MLFDSLMRNYPINSFLFWKVPKEEASEFKFYEFLRDYHQKDNRHNPKANISGSDDVMAVLDGQQWLTSLYIALKGTYAYKITYKKWDNPLAYPKKKLYINLLGLPEVSLMNMNSSSLPMQRQLSRMLTITGFQLAKY